MFDFFAVEYLVVVFCVKNYSVVKLQAQDYTFKLQPV